MATQRKVNQFKYPDLLCHHCGGTFTAANKNKYCKKPECMAAAKESCLKKPHHGASKCLGCYNYWVCGKYDDPLAVRECMTAYEFIKSRDSIKNPESMCLKVYECTKFREGVSRTLEEKAAKQKKLRELHQNSVNITPGYGGMNLV